MPLCLVKRWRVDYCRSVSQSCRMSDDERTEIVAFDTDGDGVADVRTFDTDGDGKADLMELDTNSDGEVDISKSI
ncbi:MAG TPA: hypothetical protein DGG94_05120 [Micromonosporaceae bacterium]|nr:hypothetical protein [Micromonosporaceae bacterium]HCU49180.1 hypothetical protein [Micromonosporaceae bacterium]